MVYSYDDVVMALGDLAFTKIAGEIDDDAFDYYADAIVKQAGVASAKAEDAAYREQSRNTSVAEKKNELYRRLNKRKDEQLANTVGARAKRFGTGYLDALKLKDLRSAKGIAKSLGAYGAPLGVLGLGAYAATRKNK